MPTIIIFALQLNRKKVLPLATPSGQAVVTGVFPSTPPVLTFIPTFRLFKLVDFHRFSQHHARAFRSSSIFLQKKSLRARVCTRRILDPTTSDFRTDDIHLLIILHQGDRFMLRQIIVEDQTLFSPTRRVLYFARLS